MHVAGFEINDTKRSTLARTYHTQNPHEGVQGRSGDPDEVPQYGRGGAKLTSGTVINELPLTSCRPLEYAQLLEKRTRAYVDVLG